jgi:hypothetical protein
MKPCANNLLLGEAPSAVLMIHRPEIFVAANWVMEFGARHLPRL